MKKVVYYTHQEAQSKMFELFSQGKSLIALKDDDKCPPEIKDNLTKLAKLHKQTVVALMTEKGGQDGR